MADFTSNTTRKVGAWSDALSSCVLTYDDRFLRRKVIKTRANQTLLVDLAHTTSLDHGDAFELSDGQFVEVIAAEEPLLQVTGDLVQLAWHVGNRHTPCQIEAERLLICHDHVIEDMIARLGGTTTVVREAFTPAGGAYGMGRTHSHDHGNIEHMHHHVHGDHSHHHHEHEHEHEHEH